MLFLIHIPNRCKYKIQSFTTICRWYQSKYYNLIWKDTRLPTSVTHIFQRASGNDVCLAKTCFNCFRRGNENIKTSSNSRIQINILPSHPLKKRNLSLSLMIQCSSVPSHLEQPIVPEASNILLEIIPESRLSLNFLRQSLRPGGIPPPLLLISVYGTDCISARGSEDVMDPKNAIKLF